MIKNRYDNYRMNSKRKNDLEPDYRMNPRE